MNRFVGCIFPFTKKSILTELKCAPIDVPVEVYNNQSYFFSAIKFVYIRMRVELLYLLIEELSFHIRRYRVISPVSR